MDEKTFLQKADEAWESLMELAVLIGWAIVVGFLGYFMISTIITELFNL